MRENVVHADTAERNFLRIRVVFADDFPKDEVEAFYKVGLPVFGEVWRGDDARTFYIANFIMDYKDVTAQLTVWAEDGMLSWREERY